MDLTELQNDPEGRTLIADTVRDAYELLYPLGLPPEVAGMNDDDLLKEFGEHPISLYGPMLSVLEDKYPINRVVGGAYQEVPKLVQDLWMIVGDMFDARDEEREKWQEGVAKKIINSLKKAFPEGERVRAICVYPFLVQ